MEYTFFDTGVDISFSYEVADFVSYLPRIGLAFSLPKKYGAFEYDGYGPYESYIDKRLASEYGSYRSTAKKEYFPWIKPQETGSHYGSERLKIDNALTITAEKPFSFSDFLGKIFKKSHSKKYLSFGIIFFLMSYFVVIKVYYLFCGCVFLTLSLFCRLFSKETNE